MTTSHLYLLYFSIWFEASVIVTLIGTLGVTYAGHWWSCIVHVPCLPMFSNIFLAVPEQPRSTCIKHTNIFTKRVPSKDYFSI